MPALKMGGKGPAKAMAPLVKMPMRAMGFDGDTHYGDMDTSYQNENRGAVMSRREVETAAPPMKGRAKAGAGAGM